jgi:hypothetical protein
MKTVITYVMQEWGEKEESAVFEEKTTENAER